MVSTTGMDEVQVLLDGLRVWSYRGYVDTVDRAANEVSGAVRSSLKAGEDAEGNPFEALSDVTLENPIRRDGHSSTTRGAYGATPLYATGETADSIGAERLAFGEWEVGAMTPKGDMILSSNARTSHSGIPFGGDTPKPVRDVLTASERHLDIIENRLVIDLSLLLGI